MIESPCLKIVEPEWEVFRQGAANGRGAYRVDRSPMLAGITGQVRHATQDGWLEVWYDPEQCQELFDLLSPEDEL